MAARFTLVALALMMALLAAHSGEAAPVAIVNAGFEAPYLGGNLPPQYAGDVPATAFPVGAAPAGWQSYGAVGAPAYIGVLNPGVLANEPLATAFPAGAPEGDNVVLTFYDGHAGGAEFGVQQTLAATLSDYTVYTLTVEICNIASGSSAVQPYAGFGFFDLRGFPGYRIELTAGGATIAADNDSLNPSEGLFELSTVRLVVGDEHARLGQSLGIRLVNLNLQDIDDPIIDLEVDFDDVRLDASPLSPADFNADGFVNSADLELWRGAYGMSDVGDADGDLDSNGADFLLWQRELLAPATLSTAHAVPEPGAALLAAMTSAALIAARRRA
jgi:hypothetical protein